MIIERPIKRCSSTGDYFAEQKSTKMERWFLRDKLRYQFRRVYTGQCPGGVGARVS